MHGGQIEDRDKVRGAKAAVGREAAKRQRRAGRKTKLGAAPKEQRAKEPPRPGTPPTIKIEPQERESHGREFAKMNERKAPKRVKATEERGRGEVHQPRYLSDAARGLIRNVAKAVYAPVALARAIVDRFRDRE